MCIWCALVNVSILRRSHPLPFIRSQPAGEKFFPEKWKMSTIELFLINTKVDKCGEGPSISVSGHVWLDMFSGRMRNPRNGKILWNFPPAPWAHLILYRSEKGLEGQFCTRRNLEIWTKNYELKRLRKKQVVEKGTYGWGGWPKTKCVTSLSVKINCVVFRSWKFWYWHKISRSSYITKITFEESKDLNLEFPEKGYDQKGRQDYQKMKMKSKKIKE